MTDIKRMEEPTDQICEKCGKPMVIKWGRHGKFIACTGYPECTNTREIAQEGVTEQDEQEYCENCGRPMVLKKGASASFWRAPAIPIAKPPSNWARGRSRRMFRSTSLARSAATSWSRSSALRRVRACSNYPTASTSSRKPSA
jgi:DNA topoisomerase-1